MSLRRYNPRAATVRQSHADGKQLEAGRMRTSRVRPAPNGHHRCITSVECESSSRGACNATAKSQPS